MSNSSRPKKPAIPGGEHDRDAATVKDLLLWARRNRFAISALTVGGVSLAVADVGNADVPPPRATDPLLAFGGAIGARLDKLREDAERDPLREEDPDGLGVG